METIKAYYNAIPTQLPRNLSDAAVMQEVVLAFCRDFAEQETRLNQLEAALATHTARAQAGVRPSAALHGLEFKERDAW